MRSLVLAVIAGGAIQSFAMVAAATGDSLTFSTASVDFSAGSYVYGSNPLNFGTSALSFPSTLDVTTKADTIEIVLPADILFDFDKSDLRAQATSVMQELTQIIRDKARGRVDIHGHTDGLGKDTYNQRLSERRADAVKIWLSKSGGLASSLFTTKGFGARNPIAPNVKADGSDDPDGRQLNRRVTLVIRR